MNPISIIAIVFSILSFGLSAYAVGRSARSLALKETSQTNKYCLDPTPRQKTQKQIEHRSEKKKNEAGSSQRFFVFMIVMLTALIALVNLFCLMSVCRPELIAYIFPSLQLNTIQDTTSYFNSAIESTGINIVSLAISVWIGLHVIQVLENSKLEEARMMLIDLQKEVEQSSTERWQMSLKDLCKQLNNLNDEINRYLAEHISQIDGSLLPADFIFEMAQIEAQFQRFYVAHRNGKSVSSADYNIFDRISRIESRLDEIEITDKYTHQTVYDYLRLRLAETNYYFGYSQRGYSAVNAFQKAYSIYIEVFPAYAKAENIKLRNESATETNPGNIIFDCYMLNTIGDSCSKILENAPKNLSKEKQKEIQEYSDHASDIFTTLKEIMEAHTDIKVIQREVYYRNYGCYIERKKGFNGQGKKPCITEFEEIEKIYQKAITICLSNEFKDKAFYSYLSLHHKLFDGLWGIDTIASKKNICSFSKDPCANTIADCDKLLKQIARSEQYMKLAIAKCKQTDVFMKHKAFLFRDRYIIEKYKNISSADETRKNMKNALDAVLVLGGPIDPYTKQLCAQYDYLAATSEYETYYM